MTGENWCLIDDNINTYLGGTVYFSYSFFKYSK